MNRVVAAACLMFVSLLTPLYVLAEGSGYDKEDPMLYLQSIRVKGDEFVLLQSLSADAIDLSHYKLQYFNHFDVTKATTSKLISVSSTLLPAGGTLMISDQPVYACESMIVSGESLSLTDNNGFLQLVKQTQSHQGAPVSFSVIDSFAWTNKASEVTTDVQLAIADANHFFWRQNQSDEKDINRLPYLEWTWHEAKIADDNVCEIDVIKQEQPAEKPKSQLLAPLTKSPTSQPPATILSASRQVAVVTSTSVSSPKPTYPVRSIGLEAPQITELLPNPGSPKTDADDEFIELYNGNNEIFELSGFVIRYGVSNVKDYTFPPGTLLDPKSFTAYFSADANFTLANSEGRVELVDPYGNIIGASDVYTKAKDDQSWALANGTWQWSTTPTPGIANTISQAAAKNTKTVASRKAKVAPASATGGASSNGTGAGSSVMPDQLTTVSQQDTLHPYVLAVIGSLTVGYALYEYRQDIANKIDQFRRNRANRRENRPAASRR